MMVPYYQDNAVTLYCGDAFKILPELPQGDHLITDPPFDAYTHANAKSNQSGQGNTAIDFAPIDADNLKDLFFKYRPLRWIVSFMPFRHYPTFAALLPPMAGLELIRVGVWLKNNPMPQISADRPAHGWDAIYYMHNSETKKRWNGGGSHGNWFGPVVSDGLHPTGKPLKLMQHLIKNFTDPGELIIDPFAGSGTTLVAAKALGRRAIGIELDPKYCAAAVTRLRQDVLNFEGVSNGN